MTPTIGSLIWIPCEVKPGPFVDERLVRTRSDLGEWLGFVPIESLRDAILEGDTFVRGTIVEVDDERFQALLNGHAVTPEPFVGSIAKVTSLGSVKAGHSPVYQ